MSQNELYIRLALKLAAKGRGRTSPNPMVGAVLVKDNEIVGQGYHKRFGEAHAEVNAIKMAGEKAKGATLYINLEPCCHFGRTPPCTKSIIEAGIKRVVIAMIDPNPLVCGKGFEELCRAGIETEVGILETEARKLNEAYIKYITTKMPFVALKSAMSLDGKIATSSGESRWITGEKARKFAHKLRNQYDAVLVGIGTVLKDDPLLTPWMLKRRKKSPIRIVVDSQLRIPLEAKVLATRDTSTIIATTKQAPKAKIKKLEEKGARVLRVNSEDDKVNLVDLMKKLGDLGISSLLIEGGGNINASALQARIVDKVYFFIAPKIFGGKKAITPVEGKGIDKVSEATNLKEIKIRRFDEDILIEGYVRK